MALFCKLLYVLLLICYSLCVPIYASGPAQIDETVNVEVFKQGQKITGVQKLVGDNAEIIPTKINLPISFAAKNGVMVAVANAEYTEGVSTSNGKKIDVLATFFEISGINDWKKENIEEIITKSKTQFVTEDNNGTNVFFTVTAPIVNADKSKIYVFLVSVNGPNGDQTWDFKLVEATVSGGKEKKTIEWKTIRKLNDDDTLKEKLKEYTIKSFVADGSVFLGENKRILFVVKGVCGKNKNKNVTLLFQFDETRNKLELLHHEGTEGLHSTFFWLNGELLKTPIKESKNGNDKIMVFNTNNNSFTESNSPIARLRDFLKDKKFFFNATIEGSNVLLFIQQKQNKEGNGNNAYLWMTDGSRVDSVETIVPEFKNEFYGFLSYKKNELFLLYQTNEESGQTNNKIYLARLNVQLNKIRNTLNNWNKSNVALKQRCKNTDITVIPCFTDGLVGFLSDGAEGNNKWKDDNFNMEPAMIIVEYGKKGEAKKIQNGLKFTGEGAGARWSVGEQSQDQPYNFTDPGFTLVATVRINDIAKNNVPYSVLGVGLNKKTKADTDELPKSIRLWCTEKKKWAVSEENEGGEENEKNLKESKDKCEQGKTYIVALVLKENKNLEVFINGKLSADPENKKIEIEKTDSITHFYFGADGDAEQEIKTDVTITNVLLYNRPFNTSEIELLKLKLNNTAGTKIQHEKNGIDQERNRGNTSKIDNFLPDTSTIENKTNSQTLATTTEDTAGRVSVLFSFLLFGVFTLLRRHV